LLLFAIFPGSLEPALWAVGPACARRESMPASTSGAASS
jgi:hypothetical protein